MAALLITGLLASSCATTSDSVTSNPASQDSQPSQKSTSPTNRGDQPSYTDPQIPDWIKEIGKNAAEITVDQMKNQAAKVVGKLTADLAFGAIGYLIFAGVFNGSAGDIGAANEEWFSKINKDLDLTKDHVKEITNRVTNDFKNVEVKLISNDRDVVLNRSRKYADVIDITNDYAAKVALDLSKTTKTSRDTAIADNTQFEANIKQLLDDTSRINYIKDLVGISDQKGLFQYDNQLLRARYPVASHALSEVEIANWVMYRARITQLYALLISYATSQEAGEGFKRVGEDGRAPQSLGATAMSLKGEQKDILKAVDDLYPQQIPEGSLYDTVTDTWFAVTGASTYAATNAAAQEVAARAAPEVLGDGWMENKGFEQDMKKRFNAYNPVDSTKGGQGFRELYNKPNIFPTQTTFTYPGGGQTFKCSTAESFGAYLANNTYISDEQLKDGKNETVTLLKTACSSDIYLARSNTDTEVICGPGLKPFGACSLDDRAWLDTTPYTYFPRVRGYANRAPATCVAAVYRLQKKGAAKTSFMDNNPSTNTSPVTAAGCSHTESGGNLKLDGGMYAIFTLGAMDGDSDQAKLVNGSKPRMLSLTGLNLPDYLPAPN